MTVGSGTYGRALLIFHHILSSQKKKTIGESARVLNIYGICKVGYPGMLVAEGQESELKEYTRRIKVRNEDLYDRVQRYYSYGVHH